LSVRVGRKFGKARGTGLVAGWIDDAYAWFPAFRFAVLPLPLGVTKHRTGRTGPKYRSLLCKNVLYSMPAAGKLSVGDSVPAAAKLA